MGLNELNMENNKYQVILDLLNETNSYSPKLPNNVTVLGFEELKICLLNASTDNSFISKAQIEKTNTCFDDKSKYFLQLAKLYFTALNRTERINRSVPREELNYTFAI